MVPLATVTQLAARLPGGIDEADEARAETALEDASAVVRHVAGRTWTDGDGALDSPPPIAVTITLSVAKRIFNNPHDYRSEQIGEYSWQGTAGLLTPEERHDLQDLAGDLVSVEMALPYKVSSRALRTLDSISEDEAGGWL